MSRYPPRIRSNPTENQHTEALAAVLDPDPHLCAVLAAAWLNTKPEEVLASGRVRTQVPARGLDRVDLELRFGRVGVPDWIIWVEVKVDAPLSGDDQLQRYWDALLELPARSRALVLLQRWGVGPPAEKLLPVGRDQDPTCTFLSSRGLATPRRAHRPGGDSRHL